MGVPTRIAVGTGRASTPFWIMGLVRASSRLSPRPGTMWTRMWMA